MNVTLTSHSYGKSGVRMTKVVRRGDVHELLEFEVAVQLEGAFERSYTHGDNSDVVATDSMKNTVYVLAKEREFDGPEGFAVQVAEHFVKTYPQASAATVTAVATTWARIDIAGKPHDHAFVSGGTERRVGEARATRGAVGRVTGGVDELAVLKTTKSAFKNFVNDRYRTLPDTEDRIFATNISARWDFSEPADYRVAGERAIATLLETFAGHMSYAVQETMHEMAKALIDAVPQIERVALRLPNKHRIPVNLKPFGLENNNEIFIWTDEPFGDIRCVVERRK